MQTQIQQKLEVLSISYEHFVHDPVTSVEIGKTIYKKEGIDGIHVKNLFLRNKKGSQHYLLVVLADKDVDLKDISTKVDDRKLGFASEERLWKYLQVKPGSVSPLALIHDKEVHVKVIFDEAIFEVDKIHIHPGINTESIVVSTQALKLYIESIGQSIQLIEI